MGTDIPDLSTGVMTAALAALDAAQLVLGPARDGGFYLIGATAVPPALMSVSMLHLQCDAHGIPVTARTSGTNLRSTALAPPLHRRLSCR